MLFCPKLELCSIQYYVILVQLHMVLSVLSFEKLHNHKNRRHEKYQVFCTDKMQLDIGDIVQVIA